MRIVLGGCIVVLVVLVGTLAHAVELLILYDNFNTEQVDVGKWVKGEEGAGTEPTVQIQDNRLRLFNRSYGKTDSNQGRDEGSLFLTFSNSAAVTAIQATVQVNDVGGYRLSPQLSGDPCLHTPRRVFLQYRHPDARERIA